MTDSVSDIGSITSRSIGSTGESVNESFWTTTKVKVAVIGSVVTLLVVGGVILLVFFLTKSDPVPDPNPDPDPVPKSDNKSDPEQSDKLDEKSDTDDTDSDPRRLASWPRSVWQRLNITIPCRRLS